MKKLLVPTIFLFLYSNIVGAALSVICDPSILDLQCEGLSSLVSQINDSSKVYDNYVMITDNAYDRQKEISWSNAICGNLSTSSLDCDLTIGDDSLVTLAQTSIEATLYNMSPRIDFNKKKWGTESDQSEMTSLEEKTRCACVEATTSLRFNGDENAVKNFVDGSSSRIAEMAIKAYGKKAINEYAHIYEDGMYLLNHSSVVNPNKTGDVLCRGASRFEKAIQKKCPKKNPASVNERMNLIFSELDLNGASSLEEKLSFVDYNTVHRKVKNKNGEEVTYLRSEYDKTRNGLKSTNEFQILDKMLVNLLTSKEVDLSNKNLKEYAPVDVISNELSKLFMNDFDGTVSRIFNNQVPKKYVDEWRAVLSGPSPEAEFASRFTKYFLKVAPSHPALSAILLDSELFSDFRDHARAKNIKSVFYEFENNFKDLEDHMLDRCKKMVEDFAEVVCLEDEEIVKGLTKDSITRFVNELDAESILLGVKDIMTCKAAEKLVPAFKNLDPQGTKISNSDFFNYIKDKNHPTDAYSSFAKELANNKSTGSLISYAAAISEVGSPKRTTGYNPLKHYEDKLKGSKIIDSSGTISAVSGAPRESQIQAVPERSIASVMDSQGQVTSAQINNNQSVFKSMISQITSSKSISEEGEEIVKSLSHRSDKEEITNLLSNLDTEEVKRLKEFKDNTLFEKEEALKQRLEEERKNIENLQAQIESLTNGKSIVESNKAVVNANPVNEGDEVSRSNDSSVRAFSSELRDSVNRSNFIDNKPAVNTSGSFGGGSVSASLAGAVGAVSAERSRGSVVQDSSFTPPSTAPVGIVVQSENAIVNSNQEITKNIVDYLKTVDGETFLKFTKEGVTYRYKTVEDGKVVEKEIHLSINDIDPQTLEEIARESDIKLAEVKRKYSYASLKMIITQEALKL